MNIILNYHCGFQVPELYYTVEEFISCIYIMILSCIMVMRSKHIL